MAGRLFVGTSGFAYAAWKPHFYPEGAAQARLLEHYATRLSSVEINYTFQRFPTESLLRGWASKVPEPFVFALKLPRRITHEKRLRDCDADVDRFAKAARALGDRLGPLLVQLPPTMPADLDLLDGFLETMPPGFRIAVEFRHPSWAGAPTDEALSARGASRVAAETDDSAAATADPAPGFAYLRLRAAAYPDEALDRWRREVERLLSAGCDVFCYLRHDADGSNALAAERLRASIEGRSQ